MRKGRWGSEPQSLEWMKRQPENIVILANFPVKGLFSA
jgi:hypothetical protein